VGKWISSRTTVPFPWCSRSQSFTKNIAVSNNESALKGDITNLPHVAKTVAKATTWLWFSGDPPECDLRQLSVASPRYFSRSTYISQRGQTNSQTLRRYFYLFCYRLALSRTKTSRIATAKLYFVDHRNFPDANIWSLLSTCRCSRQRIVVYHNYLHGVLYSFRIIVAQLIKKLIIFYRIWNFVAVLTRPHQWTLCWASWIRSTRCIPFLWDQINFILPHKPSLWSRLSLKF
jgi:hypothetical protein